ncbi:MAG: hypothetical protein AAF500_12200 [Myxococcota bacterium]
MKSRIWKTLLITIGVSLVGLLLMGGGHDCPPMCTAEGADCQTLCGGPFDGRCDTVSGVLECVKRPGSTGGSGGGGGRGGGVGGQGGG